MLTIIREHKGFWPQIWKLARLELKKRFKGSLLGSAWAILTPVLMLLMFWFAFTIGLRVRSDIDGVSFFLFLMAGLVPWFFIRDMINKGSKSIRSNKQYVTKINFPVSTICTFSGLSYFMVHLLLLGSMIIYLAVAGYAPTVYNLQIFFYAPLMFLFFLALSWSTATWSVFSKDLQNLISSLMTAVFWLSGILWNSYTLEIEWLRKLMLFNPVTYIVNGYRKTFLYNEWFWENPLETGVFLGMLLLVVAFGAYNYTRLRKDMADVL
ncbi:MAG: ABC transporter permease [Coriobacteriia bacterium]|nr:ABC transporter permease [Coriobacteriia bacterium]